MRSRPIRKFSRLVTHCGSSTCRRIQGRHEGRNLTASGVTQDEFQPVRHRVRLIRWVAGCVVDTPQVPGSIMKTHLPLRELRDCPVKVFPLPPVAPERIYSCLCSSAKGRPRRSKRDKFMKPFCVEGKQCRKTNSPARKGVTLARRRVINANLARPAAAPSVSQTSAHFSHLR